MALKKVHSIDRWNEIVSNPPESILVDDEIDTPSESTETPVFSLGALTEPDTWLDNIAKIEYEKMLLEMETQAVEQEETALAEKERLLEQERKALAEKRQLVEQERKALAEKIQLVEQERKALAEKALLAARERKAQAEKALLVARERKARASQMQLIEQERKAVEQAKQESTRKQERIDCDRQTTDQELEALVLGWEELVEKKAAQEQKKDTFSQDKKLLRTAKKSTGLEAISTLFSNMNKRIMVKKRKIDQAEHSQEAEKEKRQKATDRQLNERAQAPGDCAYSLFGRGASILENTAGLQQHQPATGE